MAPSLHTVLPIFGRVLAGVVGCIAFYIALFMYEDEKNEWQNRLDNFWREARERAKKTDMLFTALVNRVAAKTVSVFNRIFGKETLSLKMAVVSTNLSLVVLALLVGIPSMFERPLLADSRDLLLTALLVVSALVAVRFHRKLVLVGCLLPPTALVLDVLFNWERRSSMEAGPLWATYTGVGFIISIIVDIFVVATIRIIFSKLHTTPSLMGVAMRVLLLMIVALSASVAPLMGPFYFEDSVARHGVREYILFQCGLLNLSTLLYCIVPSIVLLGLVIHKLVWPLLARVTYPLLNLKLIQDRKFLFWVGTTAFAIAFGFTTFLAVLMKKLTP